MFGTQPPEQQLHLGEWAAEPGNQNYASEDMGFWTESF